VTILSLSLGLSQVLPPRRAVRSAFRGESGSRGRALRGGGRFEGGVEVVVVDASGKSNLSALQLAVLRLGL